MKGWRLFRWTLRILSALSLSFCILFICLGIRSYFRTDDIYAPSVRGIDSSPMVTYSYVGLFSNRGTIWLQFYRTRYSNDIFISPSAFGPTIWRVTQAQKGKSSGWTNDEFAFRLNQEPGDFSLFVVFPYWLAALVTAILPAAFIYRVIRSRRAIRAGHCRTCGYDIRATPTRCPECGNPVTSRPPPTESAATARAVAGCSDQV
jgi:hypothetical protein